MSVSTDEHRLWMLKSGFVEDARGHWSKPRAGNQGDNRSVQEGGEGEIADRSAELQNGQTGLRLDRQSDQEGHGQTAYETRARQMDGPGHPQYRVSITLRFSDYRRKDPDGCVATLMDCLTDAVGRLLGVGARIERPKRTVRTGRRRGDDNHYTPPIGKSPF